MYRSILFMGAFIFTSTILAMPVRAADAAHGKRLAQAHCAGCHIIAPHTRDEVADSPPFAVIGHKYKFNAAVIAHAIAGPHPKMNFSPRARDAADIAAYIVTLPH